MTTAKIQSIEGAPREWEGAHGKVYFYKLVMDNGDTGEIGKKKPNAFNIGDSLTYTVESGQYGNKLKEVQQNGFRGGNGQSRGSTASFALSYAKDIAVANINKSDKPLEMASLAGKVIETAGIFNTWLKENE